MKEHIRFMILLVLNFVIFYVSYILNFLLNGRFGIDPSFNGQVSSSIYYTIGIKLFVFTLFMYYQSKQYDYIRASLGIITGNILSLIYLIYIGNTITTYGMYGLTATLDLICVLAIIHLFNMISKKSIYVEDIEEINKYMEMKKDLEAIVSIINEKKEVIAQIDFMIEEKEYELSQINEQSNAVEHPIQKEDRDYVPSKIIDFDSQSDSCPFGDKSKCISDTNSEGSEEFSGRIKYITDEEELKIEIIALQKREEESNIRAKQIEKKEQIIEKAVTNLEQISKTIKDRMQLLDDKKIYISNQLKLLEEKEEQYNANVHNQLYETIFKAPEIYEDEVKLKDKSREIIINKNDLTEIRNMIERTVVE